MVSSENTDSYFKIVIPRREIDLKIKRTCPRSRALLVWFTKQIAVTELFDLPSHRGVRDAYQKMDTCMELVMEVLSLHGHLY